MSLGTKEYERDCNLILPKSPSDVNFKNTVIVFSFLFWFLVTIFVEKKTVFHTRYQWYEGKRKRQLFLYGGIFNGKPVQMFNFYIGFEVTQRQQNKDKNVSKLTNDGWGV